MKGEFVDIGLRWTVRYSLYGLTLFLFFHVKTYLPRKNFVSMDLIKNLLLQAVPVLKRILSADLKDISVT